MSYETKVYKVAGGNELVVDNGGKITMKPGSTLEIEGEIIQSITFDADYFTIDDGEVTLTITFDADYFTIDDGEVTLKTEVAALLGVVSGIPTSDPEVTGQVWLDGSTLKVSEGGGG